MISSFGIFGRFDGDFISLVSLTDGELIICNSHIHGVVYDAGSALGAW